MSFNSGYGDAGLRYLRQARRVLEQVVFRDSIKENIRYLRYNCKGLEIIVARDLKLL